MNEQLATRLAVAAERQNNYQPSNQVCREIGERILIMLVGPTAIGKTTIARQAKCLDEQFSFVKTITTRASRGPEDEDQFSCIERSDTNLSSLLNDIEQKRVVNYAIHPATSELYVTYPNGYSTTFCMLPVMASGIRQFEQLPFERIEVVGVIAEPMAWREWLNDRSESSSSDELMKRLHEAEQSLLWLINNGQNIKWLINSPGSSEAVARAMIDIAQLGQGGDRFIDTAEMAQNLLQYVQTEINNRSDYGARSY